MPAISKWMQKKNKIKDILYTAKVFLICKFLKSNGEREEFNLNHSLYTFYDIWNSLQPWMINYDFKMSAINAQSILIYRGG